MSAFALHYLYKGSRDFSRVAAVFFYSHSTVAGGLDVMSYTTRLTLGTSFVMRDEALSKSSHGRRDQSAVMKSSVDTARRAMTQP